MAKHVIAESYTFNPTTKTITITNKWVRQEQLLLITNVTRGTVLYNFSDPAIGATSFTTSANVVTGQPTTTILLNYATGSMSSTDKISIIVEETNESFQPSQEYTDPVNKFRISTPQALIDTDFEYGTQSTKWETLTMLNNRPFAYYDVTRPMNISNVFSFAANTRIFVANVFPSVPPAQGQPFFIQDTTFVGADGLYVAEYSNLAANTVQYTGKVQYTGTAANLFTSNVTSAYYGNTYSNTIITLSNVAFRGNIIDVSTAIPHGLLIGNEIALVLATGGGSFAPNGSWTVSTVTNNTSFSFFANNAPTGSIVGGNLYVRPTGQSLHRAFDGGVIFSTNAASHNNQLIRQTRRYFRYQSGKGIQVSTGSIMKPNFNIDRISASGTTITVVAKQPHNLIPGAGITVAGCNEAGYNGTWTVNLVIDAYRFTYNSTSSGMNSPASGNYVVSVSTWYGATNRLGVFDSQNGIFFEYDGTTLYAVRRSSTYQLSGFASISPGSEIVTGVTVNGISPVFSKQLIPGDFVVIKGMSYKVDSIQSDNQFTIIPSYRGVVPVTNAIVSKTVDYKIPQSEFNLDKMDGTGSSGTNLDLTKMQMFYMDYSWYGAGFIRWGFRGQNGDCVYAHKLVNNNVNYEAYMRSGNLPARYESATFPADTLLAANVTQAEVGTVFVTDTIGFPPSGSFVIRTANAYEYVGYTAKTANTFTGLTRGQTGNLNALVTATNIDNPILTTVNTTGIQIGQYVDNVDFVDTGAFVANLVSNTSITLSQAPNRTGTFGLKIAPMGRTAQVWNYSATEPIVVEHHGPIFAPTISHWGTSVIMDGRFDDDKSFVFTQGTSNGISVPANGGRAAIQSFRISPSVSSGVPGFGLGVREIVNRMQMVLRQIDLFANGSVLVSVILNGSVSPGTPNWVTAGGSSLAQYINHTPGTQITGGEVIYGFYLNTTGVATQFNTTQQDLSLVRDLGTSVLSGGNSTLANVNIYPDGPDMVTIVAQNIGPVVANINCRLSWTEAQA
jgi:hypothetical protein